MAYEEQRVVESDAAPTTEAPAREVVRTEPVVEQRPVTRTVISDDPVGNAYAASQLIQTIVWSVVVLVLLVVALVALHVYAHLF